MKETKHIPGITRPTYVVEPADRWTDDVSRGLTPEKLDSIMQDANCGNPSDQARLANEMLERDWSIFDAIQTRTLAVCGTKWRITPADESVESVETAKKLEEQLRNASSGSYELITFQDVIANLSRAIVPGYDLTEIIWGPGGTITGFYSIPAEFITFQGSMVPMIRVGNTATPSVIDTRRYIYHRAVSHGIDPTRGGLIRPLAWLYCFANLNIKDMLAFVERYGMPFVTAKVNANAWEKERSTLKRLIQNFGPSGGGVFTDNVDMQLMECSSQGDVYYNVLKIIDDAVHKVVLGQTASSGDSSGLSGGDAQSKVRQDILDADCSRIAASINSQLVSRWIKYNAEPGTKPPVFAFDRDTGEDMTALANMVGTLYAAGLAADPEELSKRFGIRLTRIQQPQQASYGSMPFGEEAKNAIPSTNVTETPLPKKTDIPPVNIPKTEKTSSEGRKMRIGEIAKEQSEKTAINIIKDGSVENWLGPARDEIVALCDEKLSEDEFADRMKKDILGGIFGPSDGIEDELVVEIASSMKEGGEK